MDDHPLKNLEILVVDDQESNLVLLTRIPGAGGLHPGQGDARSHRRPGTVRPAASRPRDAGPPHAQDGRLRADVFDALTHERPYKDAWPVADAVREILDQRERQFDPRVTDAFTGLDYASLLAPLEAWDVPGSIPAPSGNGAASLA